MAPMTIISQQVNRETGISVKLIEQADKRGNFRIVVRDDDAEQTIDILFSNNRAALETKIPAYLR
jgi:hypothetical protein